MTMQTKPFTVALLLGTPGQNETAFDELDAAIDFLLDQDADLAPVLCAGGQVLIDLDWHMIDGDVPVPGRFFAWTSEADLHLRFAYARKRLARSLAAAAHQRSVAIAASFEGAAERNRARFAVLASGYVTRRNTNH